jgi:5-methyltetrahydropteroyltriglutamate--homocysteine methyltransferase
VKLPLFPVTTVGSWPRPATLLRQQKLKRMGQLSDSDFQRSADEAIREILRTQEEVGVDMVTDGEQRRDNFYSFVAEKLSGVRLLTLAEMLEFIEDKESFEQVLQTLDVPAYSLSNPCCVGRLERRAPLAVGELEFLRQNTDRPVKIPLPGPYLLTRAMFVQELTRSVYASKEELAVDVVRVLREEIRELVAAGADFIQLDEPVLTEVVFSAGRTRTFMCASLAASGDPAEELEFAVSLVNAVTEGLDLGKTVLGLHICRGNWSQDESTLLRGSYHPLHAYLERMNVQQMVLEYATERAGDVMPLRGKSLGLGVVNPRTVSVEPARLVIEQVERALAHFAPEQLFLNPDCGFGTFSNSPVNAHSVAREKLAVIVDAARQLRARYA